MCASFGHHPLLRPGAAAMALALNVVPSREQQIGKRLRLERDRARRLAQRRTSRAERAALWPEQLEQPVRLRDAPVDLTNARRVQDGADDQVEQVGALGRVEERVRLCKVVQVARGNQQAEHKIE